MSTISPVPNSQEASSLSIHVDPLPIFSNTECTTQIAASTKSWYNFMEEAQSRFSLPSRFCLTIVFYHLKPGELQTDIETWPHDVSLKRLQSMKKMLLENIDRYYDEENKEVLSEGECDVSFLQLVYSLGFLHLQDYIQQCHPSVRASILNKLMPFTYPKLIQLSLEYNPFVVSYDLTVHLVITAALFSLRLPTPAQLKWEIEFHQSLVIPPCFSKNTLEVSETDKLMTFLICLIIEKTDRSNLHAHLEILLAQCRNSKILDWLQSLSNKTIESYPLLAKEFLTEHNPLSNLLSQFNAANSLWDADSLQNNQDTFFSLITSLRKRCFAIPKIDLKNDTVKSQIDNWLSLGDLIYGFDDTLIRLSIYTRAHIELHEYYKATPLGSHKGGIVLLNRTLFNGTQSPTITRLCNTLYKTWWYAKERRKPKGLSLADRLGEWYTIELLIEEQAWTLTENELVQIIKGFFHARNPGVPYLPFHIIQTYHKLIAARKKRDRHS